MCQDASIDGWYSKYKRADDGSIIGAHATLGIVTIEEDSIFHMQSYTACTDRYGAIFTDNLGNEYDLVWCEGIGVVSNVELSDTYYGVIPDNSALPPEMIAGVIALLELRHKYANCGICEWCDHKTMEHSSTCVQRGH